MPEEGQGSATGADHLQALLFKYLLHSIPAVTLKFDAPLLEGAAAAEALLQFGLQAPAGLLIQGQIKNHRHGFSPSPLFFETHAGRAV